MATISFILNLQHSKHSGPRRQSTPKRISTQLMDRHELLHSDNHSVHRVKLGVALPRNKGLCDGQPVVQDKAALAACLQYHMWTVQSASMSCQALQCKQPQQKPAPPLPCPPHPQHSAHPTRSPLSHAPEHSHPLVCQRCLQAAISPSCGSLRSSSSSSTSWAAVLCRRAAATSSQTLLRLLQRRRQVQHCSHP